MKLNVLHPDRIKLFLKIGICILFLNLANAQSEKSIEYKSPKKAFYFSLIPGMGQLYNRKFIKSALIISLEASAIFAWEKNLKKYNGYNDDMPLMRNRYLEKRNKYAWWIGIIYVYSMIDAVVDAHLYSFEEIMGSSLDQDKKIGEAYEK